MDFKEGELMELRPKTFCTSCYESVPYHLHTETKEISVREVSFSYEELVANCDICGTRVYVPAVNDRNCYEREKQYINRVKEIANHERTS